MLLARETLLLRRGQNLPVAHDARRGVVVVSGDAEDVHTLGLKVRFRTATETQRLKFRFQISDLKFFIPLCLCVSVANSSVLKCSLRRMARPALCPVGTIRMNSLRQ